MRCLLILRSGIINVSAVSRKGGYPQCRGSRRMDTEASLSDGTEISQVYTPVVWARWLIDRWGLFDAWLDGASVCEPTAGQGAFALALFHIARTRRIRITPELLSRITLIEMNPGHLRTFRLNAREKYDVDFPVSRLLAVDVITDPPNAEYDILLGNPPWSNFANLPSAYKEMLKPYFVSEGLIPDKKKALLGSSRTDIAALVLKVALGRLVGRNGIGCFYLPLSLFSGDDAHKGFRDYTANHRKFSVDEIYEFTSTKVFKGISTSYCCAKFQLDIRQEFPVKYFREKTGEWIEHSAKPLRMSTDQWRVIEGGSSVDFAADPVEIGLSPEQKPRQGVNTCGANAVFTFEDKPTHLPEEFVFPLATKEIWKKEDPTPRKWVLLPYAKSTGRPLSWSDIKHDDRLRDYLIKAKCKLESRKGTLIRSSIRRGIWWSLLGVGPYSFAPYKVIWEAYGKRNFDPVILSDAGGQVWQANQAMHAFIPCWNKSDAERIRSALRHPGIPALLRELNGDGKCNWAQPGKIKKILSLGKARYCQPSLVTDSDGGYRINPSSRRSFADASLRK